MVKNYLGGHSPQLRNRHGNQRQCYLFILTLLFIPFMLSCSKDEEPSTADKAMEDVSDTEWLGVDKWDGAMVLNFYSDGTYFLTIGHEIYAKGTYIQNGVNIRLNQTSHWFMAYDYSDGIISNYGMKLTIPMYYYDGEYARDFSFTLNTLAK